MTLPSRRRLLALGGSLAGLAGASLLGGCTSSLLPKPTPAPALYSLDDAAQALPPAAPAAAAPSPTLIVGVPRAAAGFDSERIVYLRKAHELDAFAFAQWADTPARMLAPMMVRALQRSGAFRAVLMAPTSAAAELRLDTELIRLQHEFVAAPSRVRLGLRAQLVDTASRRVVALREFDAIVPAASEDAYGGVVAANQAVTQVLAELAAFCAQAAAR